MHKKLQHRHDFDPLSRPDFAAGATVRIHCSDVVVVVVVLTRECQKMYGYVGAADHALIHQSCPQSSASLEVRATHGAPQ